MPSCLLACRSVHRYLLRLQVLPLPTQPCWGGPVWPFSGPAPTWPALLLLGSPWSSPLVPWSSLRWIREITPNQKPSLPGKKKKLPFFFYCKKRQRQVFRAYSKGFTVTPTLALVVLPAPPSSLPLHLFAGWLHPVHSCPAGSLQAATVQECWSLRSVPELMQATTPVGCAW